MSPAPDVLRSSPTIDDVRAFWDQRPCNIRHSTAKVGTRVYFDEVEARKYMVEPHIPAFADFNRWRGKRILEVGCGLGTAAVGFARAGADYTGVDLSETSLALARQRFDVYGLSGRFEVCDAEHLVDTVERDAFDLVFSFGVIHHTPNQRAVIEQIRQVIRRDGEFRMMLYAENSWKHAMIEAGLDQPEAQSGCPIATTYSKEAVSELVAGMFDVIDIRQAHIFPYVIGKYVQYEYEVQPWFRAMPEAMFQALERHFGWHMLITAKPI